MTLTIGNSNAVAVGVSHVFSNSHPDSDSNWRSYRLTDNISDRHTDGFSFGKSDHIAFQSSNCVAFNFSDSQSNKQPFFVSVERPNSVANNFTDSVTFG